MNAIDGERDMGEDSIMLEDFVILEVLVHSSKSSSTRNSMRLSTRHVLIRSVFTFKCWPVTRDSDNARRPQMSLSSVVSS
jgi:hypothetical protein